MEERYRKTKTNVSLLNYHFIFCPRYRRKIFINNEVEEKFKEIIASICLESELYLISIECGSDYAHVCVGALPNLSPVDVMNKIKVISSRELKIQFEHLEKMPSVWTKQFLVSLESELNDEIIKEYVESQKKRYI